MKRFAIYITFNLIITFGIGQGIIIDHNCVDISQIPASYITDVKASIKMQWCGQSHSRQGLCGLDRVEALFPDFQSEYVSDAAPTAPDWPAMSNNYMEVFYGTVGFSDPNCCTSITPEGYWNGTTGPAWTADMMSWYPFTNVSVFNWCYQLQANNSSYVQSYLNQMEAFEAAYPNCTFVYATNNAQAGGEQGLTRALNNQMIRDYCIAHNKVLFDFADLDCWYNGEHNMTTYNGTPFEIQHPAYSTEVCGHINELGYEQKGRAIWWMLARISGWSPSLVNNPSVTANRAVCNIYPNPANGFINIKIENPGKSLIIVSILDLSGAVIIREECEVLEGGFLKPINIDQLNKGLYIINIQNADKIIFDKFINL